MVTPEKCPKCGELDCIESTVVVSELSDKPNKHEKEWFCTKCRYNFDNDEATFWYDDCDPSKMKLRQIADVIFDDWKDISPYARPYVEVMTNLDNIEDSCGEEKAALIVFYFLENARGWKGETAQKIKTHLKKLIDDYNKSKEAEAEAE